MSNQPTANPLYQGDKPVQTSITPNPIGASSSAVAVAAAPPSGGPDGKEEYEEIREQVCC